MSSLANRLGGSTSARGMATSRPMDGDLPLTACFRLHAENGGTVPRTRNIGTGARGTIQCRTKWRNYRGPMVGPRKVPPFAENSPRFAFIILRCSRCLPLSIACRESSYGGRWTRIGGRYPFSTVLVSTNEPAVRISQHLEIISLISRLKSMQAILLPLISQAAYSSPCMGGMAGSHAAMSAA